MEYEYSINKSYDIVSGTIDEICKEYDMSYNNIEDDFNIDIQDESIYVNELSYKNIIILYNLSLRKILNNIEFKESLDVGDIFELTTVLNDLTSKVKKNIYSNSNKCVNILPLIMLLSKVIYNRLKVS